MERLRFGLAGRVLPRFPRREWHFQLACRHGSRMQEVVSYAIVAGGWNESRIGLACVVRATRRSRKRVPHRRWFTNIRTPGSSVNDLQTDQNMSLRETFRARIGNMSAHSRCAKPVHGTLCGEANTARILEWTGIRFYSSFLRLANHGYKTGRTIVDNMVEVMTPPITTLASGR
jgi:hypothetical protein